MAFESRHRRKDGTVFPVEVGARRSGRVADASWCPWRGTYTDRKRAEEALRESEQRWRNLTEALPQLVWTATPDGSCDYFSTQWTQHTGVPESELLGWRWLETLHPDDREPTRQAWTDSVARAAAPTTWNTASAGADGTYRWFKTRGVPIRDSEGDIFKWFGTCTDITDLRRIEEALRESEERFRGTFENAAGRHRPLRCARAAIFASIEKSATSSATPRGTARADASRTSLHPDDLSATRKVLAASLRGELPAYHVE